MKGCFLCLLFLFTALCVRCQEVIVLEKQEKLVIGKNLYYFEDKTNGLEINDVLKEENNRLLIKSNKNIPAFGLSGSTYWFKLIIKNKVDKSWLLEIALTSLSYISYFYQEEGRWQEKKTGSMRPFHGRLISNRFFVFPLKFDSQQPIVIYFKIKTMGAYTLPFTIHSNEHFISKSLKEEALYGAYLGSLLFIAFYNLLLFIGLREKNYLIYFLFVFFSAISLLSYNSYLYQYLLPDIAIPYHYLYFSFLQVQRIWMVLFAIYFLQLGKHSQVLFVLSWVDVIVMLLILFSEIFLPYHLLFEAFLHQSVITLGLTTFAGIYLWLRGVRYARFYTLGYGIYLIGVVLNYMLYHQFIPAFFLAIRGPEIGIFMEAVFLSAALSDRYQLEKRKNIREKEKAQQKMIDLQQEINEKLEQRIDERTRELIQANIEIEKQKKELYDKTIALQASNSEIQALNANLENLVNHRTRELEKAYRELDQFLYRSSHDFRRPLTTMLGLIEVAQLMDEPGQIHFIFQQIKKTVTGLDRMLLKLHALSEINNDETSIENLELDQMMEEILKRQRPLLEEKKISFQTSIQKPFIVIYDPHLVKIIVENLLENSIQFSSRTSPAILIEINEEDQQLNIVVKDNGQGIPEQYKEQIFEMFFRANENSQGNGLGLYVVKKAVEKLNGKVTIQSKGAETIFKIQLPLPAQKSF